jgi:uncharacterized membrane protein
VTFTEPVWLLVAFPLAAALWLWRPRTIALTALRIIVLLLIVLGLAGLAITLPSRAGVVIALADRSLSMPKNADAAQNETIRTLESERRGESRVGAVSFGSDVRIELPPEGARFGEFGMSAGEDGSNLHDGIDSALSLIPRGTPGRIVVMSDGRWTGKDPSAAALRAAAQGVAIDYRFLTRSSAADLAVERVDAPGSVSPGESFVVAAWIDSPRAQDVTVELKRGAATIATGTQRVAAGLNRVTFRDRAPRGGTLAYALNVAAAADDPVPENNRARVLVGVRGPKPVLVVPGSPQSRFAGLLAAGGIEVVSDARPEWSIDTLANHSAVVLENVPADDVGPDGMQTVASWVADAGGALMLTGGKSSFQAGGYFKSPLDPILPVSMEMRREHRKLDVAIVVAMDRSGSMGMTVPDGRTKMELANVAAVQVLDLLSPNDELGVVAVDSAPHVVADVDRIAGRKQLRDQILSIDIGGGGIFVYEALAMASRMLLTAKSQTRHIILFSDAADSEEPGQYRELLERCRRANITVSVIGLGTEKDVDADLLKDIARRGNGRIFFTEDANDLPRLFAQDTFVVARTAFVDEPTAVQPTPALFSLAGRAFNGMPSVGGFNMTYLRDGAQPAVMTTGEYRAPLVAAWQAGTGRVLTYAGEIDGQFTGPIAQWPQVGDFYASLVRWTAGARSALPGGMLVTQSVDRGVARISLQLDPERTASPIGALPRVTTLAGAIGGGKPAVTRAEMTWRTPDELTLDVPLRGSSTYLSSVEVPGVGRVTLPPVTLPYSPELAPAAANAGRAALERLARTTGGVERISVAGIWRDLPQRRRSIPLRSWLLLAAVVLLVLEVAERRMHVLGGWELAERLPALPRLRFRRAPRVVATAPPPVVAPPAAAEPTPSAAKEESPLVNALDEAGRRARRRV